MNLLLEPHVQFFNTLFDYNKPLKGKNQCQSHKERSKFRRLHEELFPCKVFSPYSLIWVLWKRTNLIKTEVEQRYFVALNMKSQGQGNKEWSQIRRYMYNPDLPVLPCKISSLYSLIWQRTNWNAKVNQRYYVTLKRRCQGQGHKERSKVRRLHEDLFPCKVLSLY